MKRAPGSWQHDRRHHACAGVLRGGPAFPASRQNPMQWNFRGRPTWTAPRHPGWSEPVPATIVLPRVAAPSTAIGQLLLVAAALSAVHARCISDWPRKACPPAEEGVGDMPDNRPDAHRLSTSISRIRYIMEPNMPQAQAERPDVIANASRPRSPGPSFATLSRASETQRRVKAWHIPPSPQHMCCPHRRPPAVRPAACGV